ncbi:hypothetical protein [Aquimarina intermedia]|uniref:GLPGLI family protein n=1 Tax=Aquimarina intermedia TaxID=350814 RepID=A0A5S5BTN7_9FLAO|nr:hypothetical protein [Aquimarina intermedia]TYP70377.1 hypothetical protein BD809_11341 [Aquimarina intermedia]
MKYHFVITILGVFFSICTLSAQRTNATVVFADGTHSAGLIKVVNTDELWFKNSGYSETKVFYFRSIDKILFDSNGEEIEIVRRYLKDSNKGIILEWVYHGDVVLYKISNELRIDIPNFKQNNVFQLLGSTLEASSNAYFIGKDDENTVQYLGQDSWAMTGLRKALKKYLKDCPALVEKINRNEFTEKEVVEIVTFYDEECK